MRSSAEPPVADLVAAFTARAERRPDAVVLHDRRGELTYRQLLDRATPTPAP